MWQIDFNQEKIQKELQRKSEQLKQNKIKQIKNEVKSCLKVLNLPEEIENIILEYYSFDESTIETNYSLIVKVNNCYNTNKCHLINELNVSCVTSMRNLFYQCYNFNQLLNKWDTTNVIDMGNMFHSCYKFNQIIKFNTKNVINMDNMFYECYKFNQIVNFDTINVVNATNMFGHCISLEQKNKLLIIEYQK